jgi:serine/threonine protein kinase
MASITADSFLSLLEKSELLDPEQLAEAQQIAASTSDPKKTARLLVRKGVLNRWQAGQLLNGRSNFLLGKYRLIDRLGRRGMGNLFLGRHVTMNRPVVIKIASKRISEDSRLRERFLEEARAMATLDHRNVVQAYSVDKDRDSYYTVMEYVEGRDLKEIVGSDGPLEPQLAVDLIRQAADGLAHAHEHGMIHGAIKPANLVLSLEGELKILDMGTARFDRTDAAEGGEESPEDFDFLPPELADAHAEPDARADIYSLGCSLFYLLTGRAPYPEGTAKERIELHKTGEVPSVMKERPEVPADLAKICRKMMAKSPDERFKSAEVVSRILGGIVWPAAPKTRVAPQDAAAPPPKRSRGGQPRANEPETTPRRDDAPKISVPDEGPSDSGGGLPAGFPAISVGGGATRGKAGRRVKKGKKAISDTESPAEDVTKEVAAAPSPKRTQRGGPAAAAAPTPKKDRATSPSTQGAAAGGKSKTLLIVAIAIVAVLLVAGGGVAAYMVFGGDNDDAEVAQDDASNNDEDTTATNNGEGDDDNPAETPDDEGTDTDPDAIPADDGGATDEGADNAAPDSGNETEDPGDTPADPDDGAEPDDGDATDDGDTDEIVKVDPDDDNVVEPPTSPGDGPKKPPKKEEPRVPDFKKMPSSVALPSLGVGAGADPFTTDPVTFGAVTAREMAPWDIYLAGGLFGGAKGGRMEFKRENYDEDDWDLLFTPIIRGEPSENPDKLGRAWREGDDLKFQWNEGTDVKSAGLLRFCMMTVNVDGQEHNVSFLRTKQVEPIAIALGARPKPLNLDITNIPEPEKLRFEIQMPKGGSLPGAQQEPNAPVPVGKDVFLGVGWQDYHKNQQKGVVWQFKVTSSARTGLRLEQALVVAPPANIVALCPLPPDRRKQLEDVIKKQEGEYKKADHNGKLRMSQVLNQFVYQRWVDDFVGKFEDGAKVEYRVFLQVDAHELDLVRSTGFAKK